MAGSKQKSGGNKKKSSGSRVARRQKNAASRDRKKLKAVLWHNGFAAASLRSKTFLGGEAALRKLLPPLAKRRESIALALARTA